MELQSCLKEASRDLNWQEPQIWGPPYRDSFHKSKNVAFETNNSVPTKKCLKQKTIWVEKRTCLSPDGQILVLLDIQHDFQPVSHPALLGFPGCRLVAIKSVAFPISGVNLERDRFISGTATKTWQGPRAGCDEHWKHRRDMEQKVNKHAESCLGRLREYYPQTPGSRLLAPSLMDLDKLNLNQLPVLLAQTLHNAAPYYHATILSKGVKNKP